MAYIPEIVPTVNSANNVLPSDVIGNKQDLVQIPFVPDNDSILAFLKTAYYHTHGASFLYPKYADSVTLTAGTGVWNTGGAITEIIPANTITKPFDLHYAIISLISALCHADIDIYAGSAGSEVQISGGIRVFRDSNFVFEGSHTILVSQIPANTRISAKISDSTTGSITLRIAFEGHVYSSSLV